MAGKLCRKEGRVLTCDAVAVVHDESGGDDDEYVRLGVPGGGGEFGHGPLELGHGARARGSDQTHGCRRVRITNDTSGRSEACESFRRVQSCNQKNVLSPPHSRSQQHPLPLIRPVRRPSQLPGGPVVQVQLDRQHLRPRVQTDQLQPIQQSLA